MNPAYAGPGVVFSNFILNPRVAYVMYFGNYKYACTLNPLGKRLEKEYKKPVKAIHVFPYLPPEGMKGNFIVVNSGLLGKPTTAKDNPEFYPEVSLSPYLRSIVKSILGQQSSLYMSPQQNHREFTLPDLDERIRVVGPERELFEHYDNKLIQHAMASELGLPVPKTFTAATFEELVKLYETEFNSGSAFVKVPRGGAGRGCQVVTCLEDLMGADKLNGAEGYLISELLDIAQCVSSTSVVANREEAAVVSIQDLIVDGATYTGNIYPSTAPQEITDQVNECTLNIASAMGQKGFRGLLGIDFMISSDGRLYFTEINPRKMGSLPELTYAYNTIAPNSPSPAELELIAVSKGTFKGEEMAPWPAISWGSHIVYAKKGTAMNSFHPKPPKEANLFAHGGTAVLEFFPKGTEFLDDMMVARVINAGNQRAGIEKSLFEAAATVRVS
jgi:hypothetical protein